MSVQTHLLSRKLKSDEDVHALFSVQPGRKAILFIHGYTGDALATWADFPLLLPGNHKFSKHDIYFYGYDGLRAPVTASSSLFRQFLDRLFTNTAQLVNENISDAGISRANDFQYDEFMIVAHSLGAVITRRMLVDSTKTNRSWVDKIKLVLYAPAHKGAKVGELALEVVTHFKFMRWFSSFVKIVSPLIDELNPDKSDLLKRLQQDTIAMCAEGKNSHLVAHRVFWAELENIVINEDFGNDPLGEAVKGTTHTSVCKPKSGSAKPLTLLEECL